MPAGNPRAKLWTVTTALSEAEEALGKPLAGPVGEDIKGILETNGLSFEHSTYRTTLYPVRPPKNDPSRIAETGISAAESLRNLHLSIRQHSPNCLLALGEIPFRELTGRDGSILKYRGSILPYRFDSRIKVVSTVHPVTINKAYMGEAQAPEHYYKYLIQTDVAKAIRESKAATWDLPKRIITIAKSGSQLWQWYSSNVPKTVPRRISVDVECFKTIPICMAVSYDGIHGVSFPLLNMPFAKDWVNIPESELLYIWNIVNMMFSDPDTEVVGQYVKFDWEKLYHAYGFRPNRFGGDSLSLGAILCPEFPQGLGFLASIYTDEPYWKDEGKDYWTEGGFRRNSVDQLMTYNAKDAIVTWEIIDKQLAEVDARGMRDFYENQVRPLHDLYTAIEREGLDYDFDEKAGVYLKYLLRQAEGEAELNRLVGWKFNHRSTKNMRKLFFEDLRFPPRESLNEDTLVYLYGNHTGGEGGELKRRIIDLILDLKKVDKGIQFCHSLPDWDGKYRTVYNPSKTETGRSSTSIQDPPQRINFKNGKKKVNLGLAFQTIAKHGELGKDIRRIFIAPEGYYFLESDLSQAEARIVAHLAGDVETLRLFSSTDIHTLTTTWIFGISYDAVTRELRFVGKTCRHAGNYGMGKRRLMYEIITGAKKNGLVLPPIDERRAGEILEKFHSNTPKIKSVFHAEIQRLLAECGCVLTNPYGRVRQFLGWWGSSMYQEAYAQIPQSTVRDKMIESMVELRRQKPGVRIVKEDHDAFTLLVKEDEVDEYRKLVPEILSRPIDFSRCSIPRGELVIPADTKVGKSLGSMK